MIKTARGGGSVTPEFMVQLNAFVNAGTLQIYEQMQITHSCFDTGQRKWIIQFSGRITEQFDAIWLGTGACLDVNKIDCLKTLRQCHPINSVNGLPILTNGN